MKGVWFYGGVSRWAPPTGITQNLSFGSNLFVGGGTTKQPPRYSVIQPPSRARNRTTCFIAVYTYAVLTPTPAVTRTICKQSCGNYTKPRFLEQSPFSLPSVSCSATSHQPPAASIQPPDDTPRHVVSVGGSPFPRPRPCIGEKLTLGGCRRKHCARVEVLGKHSRVTSASTLWPAVPTAMRTVLLLFV